MFRAGTRRKEKERNSLRGFSLLELMVAMAILLTVTGIIMSGMVQTSKLQGTISNRTEMHASVRSATELLQQEIGQAGRAAMPSALTLTTAVASGAQTATVSSTSGLFQNEQLVSDTGANQETVIITAAPTATQFTAVFVQAHASGAPVAVLGGFAAGIIPTTATNGSTGSLLKMFGDINSDGNMVYVEYNCDTAGGNLYRNVMSFSAGSKPALTPAMVLLPNILANPDGSACFSYKQKVVGANTYVIDVAVTLTVQTQQLDPQTGLRQQETKALLNVSPRNVFEAWEMASGGLMTRIQATPASVTSLLAN